MSRVVSLNPSAKGSAFLRAVIAQTLYAKDAGAGEHMARTRYGEDSLASRIMQAGGMEQLAFEKASVAAGSRVSGSWAELLADAESATAEFFSLVREQTLFGRIPGFRRVPLRVRLIAAATGFSAAWVGEGKAVPVSNATFEQETLNPLKVAALTVVTEELLNSSDPAAEPIIRADLAGAIAEAINVSFLDPENDGEADVEPASITAGAPTLAHGDYDAEEALFQLRELIGMFPGDLERAVLIGSPRSFARLHSPGFLPDLGVRGGNALGIPAIATSAAGDTLTLVDPEGIAVGEGTIDVRTSTEASIEMLDSSLEQSAVSPVAGAYTTALWQTNAAGIMATATVNWQAARPSVATLTGIPQGYPES